MSLLATVGLLSFLVGVLVGVVADDAFELLTSRAAHSRKGSSMRSTLCWLRNNTLVLVVIVFAVSQALLAVLLIQQRASNADYTRCTANWQQAFSASYSARVDASIDASTALDRLIRAVASQDREEFSSALKNYIDVRNKQRAAQEANPLPEPPQEACGVTDK